MTAAIGLTGGIGSGKSTAASMFADLCVPILDLDAVGRQLTKIGSPALAELVETFGARILKPDGGLDRARLAELCFGEARRTRQLNAVMHPRIRDEERRWLQQQAAPYALIEASVLLESGAYARMDAVIVVLSDATLRRRRVLQRGRQSISMFEAIAARQCDDAERRQRADYLLENNGGINELRQQVEKLYRLLEGRFRS